MNASCMFKGFLFCIRFVAFSSLWPGQISRCFVPELLRRAVSRLKLLDLSPFPVIEVRDMPSLRSGSLLVFSSLGFMLSLFI